MKKLIAVLITSLVISGCTPKEVVKEKLVYVAIPVNLPQKPNIPKIPAESLSCLTDDQINSLIKRDTIIKSYIADLEANIEATHDTK